MKNLLTRALNPEVVIPAGLVVGIVLSVIFGVMLVTEWSRPIAAQQPTGPTLDPTDLGQPVPAPRIVLRDQMVLYATGQTCDPRFPGPLVIDRDPTLPPGERDKAVRFCLGGLVYESR